MILYHGSDVEVKEPKIITSEKGRDFGQAFYLTPIKEQAEKMAKRKKRINGTNCAFVSVFEWNEDKNGINYKCFKKADMEWLDTIIECRNNPKYKHGYDIVEGKIADDNVGETILFVLENVMRKEDALERIKYQKINSQVAFCTKTALEQLKFLESYEVK